MEEVENIKQLLLSDDSKELGLEKCKELGLTDEVVESLSNEVVKEIKTSWGLYTNGDIITEFIVILDENELYLNVRSFSTACKLMHHLQIIVNDLRYEIHQDYELIKFAKKREDLIKELSR